MEGWGRAVAAVEVVGSGIRKKNIERESSDQTALIRRGGRRGGVAVSFGGSSGGGGGWR